MVAGTSYTRHLQLFFKQNLCNEEVAKEPKSSQIAKQKFWNQVLLKRAKALGFGSKRANLATLLQGHDKMQYLETTADAAFEILKNKFQYVSDQLELNSKQHQAVKGRFVSYLHVAVGFNSSCYDIHWRKRTC